MCVAEIINCIKIGRREKRSAMGRSAMSRHEAAHGVSRKPYVAGGKAYATG